MASFTGGKNPPWARPATSSVNSGLPVAAAIPQAATPTVQVAPNPVMPQQAVFTIASTQAAAVQQAQYTAQQMAISQLAQPPNLPQTAVPPLASQVLPQPGIAIPTTLATSQVATVSYPAPRASTPAPGPGPQPKQRVFTGTVTKLHDNFGFVDEDVFFQHTCVKGPIPKVGERVLVEATYNANMPFKWNATRIQVMASQVGGLGAQQPPPVAFKPAGVVPPPPLGPAIPPTMLAGPPPAPQPLMGTNLSQPPPGYGKAGQNRFAQNRQESRDRNERRERNRDRRSPPRRRSPTRRRSRSPRRSPSRKSRSPLRKKPALVIRRYNVQIPKINLDVKEGSVTALRSRYSNMYIPSDFFHARFMWVDAFPEYRPFQLGNHCGFHVMHKEVSPLKVQESVLDPPDADYTWSAKVMLLASPTLSDLYHRSCALAEDPSEQQEDFQHPTRLLQFLVGMKGKSEPMAIGGPWSPSLDGRNPEEDPRVLINTAIRTTRALTGIDLGGCTQWYRFAEIRYQRPEETHKGRHKPARVETVVLFLPDVWRCQPSQLEWELLHTGYKKLLQTKLGADKEDAQDEEEEDGEQAAVNADPSHYSELDPKNMKVTDLRRELEARTLSSKGLKSQLIARLTKALKTEQEKEQEEAEKKESQEQMEEEKDEEQVQKEKEEAERLAKEEEERRKKEEREKALLERHYTLPSEAAIIVHPSTTAKSGKFDCSVMNLSVLLDYRPEDTKEHSFEVSLFAELFNEMLMRDFGFRIYHSLSAAPDRKEEEKEKKDKDKDKEDDKKDKKEKDSDKEKEKEGTEEPVAKKMKTEGEEEKDEEEKKEKDRDRDKERRREERRKEKQKQHTVEPALLLAFIYFDQNHTGYLLDKDVEDILHMLGLQLSRAQARRLVQKLVSRDTLTYRKLTDRPLSKEGEGEEKKDEKQTEDPISELSIEELKQRCLGNRKLVQKVPDSAADDSSIKDNPEATEGSSSGLVKYNGALVDVGSILTQLETSEGTRSKLEAKLRELQGDMVGLRASFSSSEQTSQKAAQELKQLREQLTVEVERKTHAEQHRGEVVSTLQCVRGSLSDLMERLTRVLPQGDSKLDIKKEVVSNGD